MVGSVGGVPDERLEDWALEKLRSSCLDMYNHKMGSAKSVPNLFFRYPSCLAVYLSEIFQWGQDENDDDTEEMVRYVNWLEENFDYFSERKPTKTIQSLASSGMVLKSRTRGKKVGLKLGPSQRPKDNIQVKRGKYNKRSLAVNKNVTSVRGMAASIQDVDQDVDEDSDKDHVHWNKDQQDDLVIVQGGSAAGKPPGHLKRPKINLTSSSEDNDDDGAPNVSSANWPSPALPVQRGATGLQKSLPIPVGTDRVTPGSVVNDGPLECSDSKSGPSGSMGPPPVVLVKLRWEDASRRMTCLPLIKDTLSQMTVFSLIDRIKKDSGRDCGYGVCICLSDGTELLGTCALDLVLSLEQSTILLIRKKEIPLESEHGDRKYNIHDEDDVSAPNERGNKCKLPGGCLLDVYHKNCLENDHRHSALLARAISEMTTLERANGTSIFISAVGDRLRETSVAIGRLSLQLFFKSILEYCQCNKSIVRVSLSFELLREDDPAPNENSPGQSMPLFPVCSLKISHCSRGLVFSVLGSIPYSKVDTLDLSFNSLHDGDCFQALDGWHKDNFGPLKMVSLKGNRLSFDGKDGEDMYHWNSLMAKVGPTIEELDVSENMSMKGPVSIVNFSMWINKMSPNAVPLKKLFMGPFSGPHNRTEPCEQSFGDSREGSSFDAFCADSLDASLSCFSFLKKTGSLESLSIVGCPFLGDHHLPSLIHGNIQSYDFSYNKGLTNMDILFRDVCVKYRGSLAHEPGRLSVILDGNDRICRPALFPVAGGKAGHLPKKNVHLAVSLERCLLTVDSFFEILHVMARHFDAVSYLSISRNTLFFALNEFIVFLERLSKGTHLKDAPAKLDVSNTFSSYKAGAESTPDYRLFCV